MIKEIQIRVTLKEEEQGDILLVKSATFIHSRLKTIGKRNFQRN